MKVKFLGVLVAILGLLGVAPLFAHHGFNVEFDGTKCMDLKGTLSNILWENCRTLAVRQSPGISK